MIVQIHFSQSEIKQYFERQGIQVVKKTFGRWIPAYHNQQRWMEYEADAVIIDGQVREASTFFSELMEERLKNEVLHAKDSLNTGIENNTLKTTR